MVIHCLLEWKDLEKNNYSQKYINYVLKNKKFDLSKKITKIKLPAGWFFQQVQR